MFGVHTEFVVAAVTGDDVLSQRGLIGDAVDEPNGGDLTSDETGLGRFNVGRTRQSFASSADRWWFTETRAAVSSWLF